MSSGWSLAPAAQAPAAQALVAQAPAGKAPARARPREQQVKPLAPEIQQDGHWALYIARRLGFAQAESRS